MITIEDVIQNAKIVGIDVSNNRSSEIWATDLLELAKQFVINERELCAKVCEARYNSPDFNDEAIECADAIRSRSNEH